MSSIPPVYYTSTGIATFKKYSNLPSPTSEPLILDSRLFTSPAHLYSSPPQISTSLNNTTPASTAETSEKKEYGSIASSSSALRTQSSSVVDLQKRTSSRQQDNHPGRIKYRRNKSSHTFSKIDRRKTHDLHQRTMQEQASQGNTLSDRTTSGPFIKLQPEDIGETPESHQMKMQQAQDDHSLSSRTISGPFLRLKSEDINETEESRCLKTFELQQKFFQEGELQRAYANQSKERLWELQRQSSGPYSILSREDMEGCPWRRKMQHDIGDRLHFAITESQKNLPKESQSEPSQLSSSSSALPSSSNGPIAKVRRPSIFSPYSKEPKENGDLDKREVLSPISSYASPFLGKDVAPLLSRKDSSEIDDFVKLDKKSRKRHERFNRADLPKASPALSRTGRKNYYGLDDNETESGSNKRLKSESSSMPKSSASSISSSSSLSASTGTVKSDLVFSSHNHTDKNIRPLLSREDSSEIEKHANVSRKNRDPFSNLAIALPTAPPLVRTGSKNYYRIDDETESSSNKRLKSESSSMPESSPPPFLRPSSSAATIVIDCEEEESEMGKM